MGYLYYGLVFIGTALITFGILEDNSAVLLPGMVVMVAAIVWRDQERMPDGTSGKVLSVYYALILVGGVLIGAAFAVESVALLVPGVLAAVAAYIVRDRIGDAARSNQA